MPTYPYRCVNCGAEFEVEQKITDEPLEFYRHTPETHPNEPKLHVRRDQRTCSGQVKRQIGPTSFVLKGKGWAADGYSARSNGKSRTTR
jgi:predicted nucleic acid-binding Zn ribbon protein